MGLAFCLITEGDSSLVGDDDDAPSHGGALMKLGGHTWQQLDLGGMVGWAIGEAVIQGAVPVEEEQA
jgi:hypothetical protein